MRFTAFFMAGLVSALALAMATSALADTTIYASDNTGGPPSPTFIALGIPVTAQVGAACDGTTLPKTTVDMGVLNQALTLHQVELAIVCNGPFRMGIVSSNGGMLSGAPTPGGYANLRDYNVQLDIVDNNNAHNFSSTCLASSLTASAPSSTCATNLRGPASTSSPGFEVITPSNGKTSELDITDAPLPVGTLVAATDYTDTLTITLSAAV
jgi:hypothetical protein